MEQGALRSIRRVTVAAAMLFASVAAGSAPPVSAQPGVQPAARHCVVRVTGELATGEMVVTAPRCFGSFAQAMRAAGLGEHVTNPQLALAALETTSVVIGIHYDGASYTGSSFTVVGADCTGGYINMSSTWNDRVSSTISNYCGRVRHWTEYNKAGSYQDTVPNGNLSSPVNNAVSSIQYLT